MTKKKIAVIGSGNWGTTVARLIAINLNEKQELSDYDRKVEMWVFEETLKDGRKLSGIINSDHVNVKYLPHVSLPENLHANPILENTVKGANILIIVTPHQFVRRVSSDIAKFIDKKQKKNLVIVCLSKGIEFSEKEKKIRRMTEVLRRSLVLRTASLQRFQALISHWKLLTASLRKQL